MKTKKPYQNNKKYMMKEVLVKMLTLTRTKCGSTLKQSSCLLTVRYTWIRIRQLIIAFVEGSILQLMTLAIKHFPSQMTVMMKK